ncbi:hypothetical protein EVJ58_g4738 [Rhodofomes roseus]|uniref:Nuclear transport factor 2 domain-containing protein n=1 Tax=Rhodofomes roseus TaxID=34475 RepID=A0A4Y9YGD7_9APHY|nr:hypothetical protein EVJ58_g4738 [Rhodofomes roseus]
MDLRGQPCHLIVQKSAAVQPGEPPAAASNNHPAGRHKKWRSRRGGSGSKASTHSPAVSERDYIAENEHAAEPPRKKRKITPDIPDLEYPSYSDIVAPSPPSIDPQLPAASDAIATNVTPPVAGPSEATVKHERSPSPALPSGPVPVKEGALRCAPIPEACKKGRPGFQEKRRAWVAEKKKYLQKLNIEPVRVFLRDDGMVIDWSSPIPVMSDTLLPPRPADNATMPCDRESSPEIIEIDNPGLPAPPNGASLPRRSTANPIRPLISSKEDDDTDVLPRAIPNNAPARSRWISYQLIPNTSPPPLSAEEAELERGALAFLRNYIRLFDRDRTALVRAYSHVATFSVTTHDPSRPASLPSPRALARRLRQGRTDLLGGLLLLPAGRKFLPEGPRGVKYDVVCLGAENKLEVLLMCYVEETKDEDGLVWACDQRFVLRKKEWDDVDRSTGGLWPLVAVSHQMTIREKIPELPRPTAL